MNSAAGVRGVSIRHSQATPEFCLAVVEKNWEKAWYQYYVTGQKWWIRLVRNAWFRDDGSMDQKSS